jgi:hypothetical protein
MRLVASCIGFLLFLILSACVDDEPSETAVAYGPGGELCEYEPLADGNARIVCPDGDSALLYLDDGDAVVRTALDF